MRMRICAHALIIINNNNNYYYYVIESIIDQNIDFCDNYRDLKIVLAALAFHSHQGSVPYTI